eukprot:4717771-Pyramimonas_sp.AAC.1
MSCNTHKFPLPNNALANLVSRHAGLEPARKLLVDAVMSSGEGSSDGSNVLFIRRQLAMVEACAAAAAREGQRQRQRR